MVQLGKFIFYFTICLFCYGCSKTADTIPNQVGVWDLSQTQTTFLNDVQESRYTSKAKLTLTADNKGTIEYSFGLKSSVNWYYNPKNSKFFLSILQDFSGSQSYNNILFDVTTDKANLQVWQSEQTYILYQTQDKQRTVDYWELKK